MCTDQKHNTRYLSIIMFVVLAIALGLVVTGCSVKQGPAGPRGLAGKNGQGLSGKHGSSCTVEQTANGAVILCEDGTSAVIVNGTDGAQGEQGEAGENGQDLLPGAYTIAEIFDPCSDGPGYDEVLLVLQNGQILAHYSGGGNLQFLSLIGPGNYRTTDQQSCNFTVTTAGEIID